MIKLQFNGITALVIAFSGVTIGYSFFQPFHKDAVHQAIPQESSFVFKAGNLNELLQSPVCSQLDNLLKPESSLRKLTSDNKWIDWIACSEIAVADILQNNYNNRKTWAGATWVGWRSPWIRWKLEHAKDPSLKFLGKRSVWPIWEYESEHLSDNRRLTFCLTDNLFLICVSDNPLDIVTLIDTYDHYTERTLP